MIIRCPSCNERISNKNAICPHCQFDLKETGEGLSYDDAQRRQSRTRRQALEMQSYGALALATGGALWTWYVTDELSRAPGFWPVATFSAGGLWYIGVRIMMIIHKLRS